MAALSPHMTEKIERTRRAARELEAALNDLGSDSTMDKLQARIEVVEVQEIASATPRRMFSIRIGGSAQWCITG